MDTAESRLGGLTVFSMALVILAVGGGDIAADPTASSGTSHCGRKQDVPR